ncbi:hypothetical protein [Variovorax sp. W2I14]|uniref:hypothetical protein n=1 Tax=Variovorax sp. W2I14 TaxID=3042290 RepID=UPI003D23D0BD
MTIEADVNIAEIPYEQASLTAIARSAIADQSEPKARPDINFGGNPDAHLLFEGSAGGA